MSIPTLSPKVVRGSVRGYLLAFMTLALLPLWLWADAPAWWTEQGVLNTGSGVVADDYAAANQGQVKNIAKKAYMAMQAKGLVEANSPLTTMVEAWDAVVANPGPTTDDYAAINLGQLKNVAAPFYIRLREMNYTGQPFLPSQSPTEVNPYPWSFSATTADDYALANIGQVKNLFSFAITSPVDPNDTDSDGLPDDSEMFYFGNLDQTATGDADGDGLTNTAEFLSGSNPSIQAQSVSASGMGLVVYSP